MQKQRETLAANASGLSGTLMATVQNGLATFSNLVLGTLGSGYTLLATTFGLPAATSDPFDVKDQLVVTTQPPSTVTAGIAELRSA